jgi:hypothetical protein
LFYGFFENSTTNFKIYGLELKLKIEFKIVPFAPNLANFKSNIFSINSELAPNNGPMAQ